MKKYLSDLINELPTNCLFDKGKVGCGGTSLAIECDKPYVICVPFVSLVENKLAQYPNERRKEAILGVYAGINKTDIKKYIESVKCPKIVVTYDSLYKVMDIINPEEYNLLIDEYHLLFNQYSFRREAIQSVLKCYNKFKTYTFMTATPLEEEFILDELKDIELIKQDWDDVINVKVQAVKCENVEASTIKLIDGFLNGQVEGNAYIFVNSVDFIKNIIKKAKLTSNNTRVIYSKNNKTKLSIPNSTVLDEPKKINLLTSTVFEGSDIYDENGRIIIVSDPSKANTLLDISTSIQQIAGRIRNSKYINWITHIYSTTRYSDLSYEEFKKLNLKNIEETKIAVEAYNKLPEIAKRKLREFTADAYIKLDWDDVFEFDPNMAKIDMFNYKVSRGLYSARANLSKEYINKGFDKVVDQSDNSIKIDLDKTSYTFKDIIKEVREEYETTYKLATPILNDALIKYPWLLDAINKLGFEKMATLNYRVSKIKDELLKVSDRTINNKIAIKLNKDISLGMWYSNKEIKNMLINAFKIANINNTPKATDINKFYEVKRSNRRIDGKQVDGYIILGKKYIFM